MPWAPGPGHGFTGPGVEPWLPFGDDADERNAETQLADEASILNLYRRLLRLRESRPSLLHGSIEFLDDLPGDVLGFVRVSGPERTAVFINFSNEARHVTTEPHFVMMLSTDHTRASVGAGAMELAPCEAIVIDPGPDA